MSLNVFRKDIVESMKQRQPKRAIYVARVTNHNVLLTLRKSHVLTPTHQNAPDVRNPADVLFMFFDSDFILRRISP